MNGSRGDDPSHIAALVISYNSTFGFYLRLRLILLASTQKIHTDSGEQYSPYLFTIHTCHRILPSLLYVGRTGLRKKERIKASWYKRAIAHSTKSLHIAHLCRTCRSYYKVTAFHHPIIQLKELVSYQWLCCLSTCIGAKDVAMILMRA